MVDHAPRSLMSHANSQMNTAGPQAPAVRRAVILAAGKGTRLQPLTANLPKCLVEVGGQPLLARALRALSSQGVAEAVIVIGYGPAGRQVSEALRDNGLVPGIIELNPDAIHRARDMGLRIHIGDATSSDVLTHAGVPDTLAVIVTVPDPRTARDTIAAVRALAPQAHLIVRSRFQRACQDLKDAGATTVVDEENTVGRLLAHEALTSLQLGQDAGLACALAGRSPSVTATPKPDMP